jgi:hypothetical protein
MMPICMGGIVSPAASAFRHRADGHRGAHLRYRPDASPSRSATPGDVPERTPDMLFVIIIILLVLALGGFIGRNRYSRR